MTITESIEITQVPDGTSPTGSRLEIRLKGDHEFAHPGHESSIAYMMTAAIFHLAKHGVVAKAMTHLYGIEITGSMKMEEQGE